MTTMPEHAEERLVALLDGIRNACRMVLGDNLVGVYVHGSIVLACFNWQKSDVDYLIVVRSPLSPTDKLRLMDATVALDRQAPPKGLEMSVVLAQHCRAFLHPMPFELHFSHIHLAAYTRHPEAYCAAMHGTDADLAAHIAVIRHKGMALCGEAITTLFAPVPAESYADSIRRDVRDAVPQASANPVYAVLTLCRALAFLEDELILSKYEGGAWGLVALPDDYHALIIAAMQDYAADIPAAMDAALLADFCAYMLARIMPAETKP